MALHITTPTGNDRLLRLRPENLPLIQDLSAAQSAKRHAEAEARAADKIAKPLKAKLLSLLGGAVAAVCGNAVISLKTATDAEATVTLADGTLIPWSQVSAIVVGNHQYVADGAKLFGGRSGSVSIDISGA